MSPRGCGGVFGNMDEAIGWGVPLATTRGMKPRADALNELMERYAAGDEKAFDPIYRQLSVPLYRFCLRLATRRPEADDLFQDTFLKLHRARATYAPGSNALHWAYAIARSLYVSGIRYWNRRPEQVGPTGDIADSHDIRVDCDTTPEAEVVAEHLLDVVSSELGKMSEKNRSAYVLIREEGLSARDAAALLGTTTDVVKQRAHRACEHLKAALGDAGWKEYGQDTY
jgi:RNA polymerase sigma-70 factor, ECF subfamily